MSSARPRTRREPLPNFATGFNPALSHGWIDKFALTLRGASIPTVTNTELLRHLRRSARIDGPLRVPSEELHGAVCVEIRQGWLFGGQLRIHPANSRLVGRGLELRLKLNPTRFFQHKGFRFDRATERPGNICILRPMNDRRVQALRESLRFGDNLISEDYLGDAVRADWPALTLRYVELVLDELEEALNAGGGPSQWNERITFDLHAWNSWTVTAAEVYWEARGDDAVAFVASALENASV